jgi:hypothetical protein
MKITSDLTNLTTAILILTVQMFIEWTLFFDQQESFSQFICSNFSDRSREMVSTGELTSSG